MALPPTDLTNEAFLREVDEELRRDQVVQLWRRWGRWAIAVAVVGLLAFVGMLYFQSRSDRLASKQGEEFDQALRDLSANRTAKAEPVFATLASSGEPGYRAMSRFAEANILAGKKDVKGASTKFGAIAADASLPKPIRELATLRQTFVEYDVLKPEAVIDRLKELAVPDSAWFGSAGELVAAAYLKQGKRDLAGKLYGQLARSEKVAESTRQRAVQMASLLGVDATAQSGEKKTQ